MASIEAYLAKMPGVRDAVRARRDTIAARARANFAPHDNPNGHRIRTTMGQYDGFVWLEGEAPGALELGHFTPDGSKFVDGIHVLTKAAR